MFTSTIRLLLMAVLWASVEGFSKHPQYGIKKTGMTAVLHTWGGAASRQNLSLHPHQTVRRFGCIVPAGGLGHDHKWKNLKGNANTKGKGFLYPMDELKKIYKAKFMAALRKLIKQGLIQQQQPGFLNQVFLKDWVVYAKRPFAGAKQVIEYLGRYTHKVAISNHRIQSIDATHVSFANKDYKDKGKTKTMSLEGPEFLRRFSQHILPSGFTKIRHFGLHAGANQHVMDDLYEEFYHKPRPPQTKKTWQEIAHQKTGFIPEQCPKCKENTLKNRANWLQGRAPPVEYKHLIVSSN